MTRRPPPWTGGLLAPAPTPWILVRVHVHHRERDVRVALHRRLPQEALDVHDHGHGHVALALGEHARAPGVLNAGVLLLVVRAAVERYALSTTICPQPGGRAVASSGCIINVT